MNNEMIFVFVLLTATIAVFVWDRFRMDVVALTVLAILALSGIITPSEAVAGFGSSVVLMIAGLFVVGEALLKTGIAAATGRWLMRVGQGSSRRLMFFLLPLVAILSAFMSSTGAVALLIPVVLVMVRQSDLSAGKVMMPLAFASLIGGMMTLIGTPPNIIVSGALSKAGFAPFSFFDFTPIGVIILAVGMVYLLTVAQWLLPNEHTTAHPENRSSLNTLAQRYNLNRQLYKMTPQPSSPLIGQTVLQARLRRRYGATLFALKRRGLMVSSFVPVLLNTLIQNADELWIYIEPEKADMLADDMGLDVQPISSQALLAMQQQFGYAEVLVVPGSSLSGKTLLEGNFRDRYGLNVVGIRRNEAIIDIDYDETRLNDGDGLLLAGDWSHIRRLGDVDDLLVFNAPIEIDDAPERIEKAPYALGILLTLLCVMTMGWLPNLTAIIVAALAMIFTGCLTINQAYRALNPTSLVLIAGMLPMATAMDHSGALLFVVNHLVDWFAQSSPIWLSVIFFILTSLLSQFISNTATTVLMAPIAVQAAAALQFAPEPLLMTVAIAASTAFATPIASPVNTLVITPGRYTFMDFVKVGLGLQILVMVIAIAVIPLFFPY